MPSKCKEIWESSADFVEAFDRLSQDFPNCECENCSASIHSRCAGAGNEKVIRRLFLPFHLNPVTK